MVGNSMVRPAKGIRVRLATVRDLETLVHQRREMWRAMEDHTETELDAADRAYRVWARPRLQNGTLVGLLAEAADGRVVAGGCVWLRENQPRPGWEDQTVPYLLSMYTEPEQRGKGLASRIVREAIRWSRSHGYARLVLHASDEGRGVYQRLGFTRTWEMRYRLSPTRQRESSRGRARIPAPRRPTAASRRRGARGSRAHR